MCSAEYILHSAHLAGGAEELRSTRGDLHSFSNSSLEQKNMYQNVINRRAQRNVNEYDEIIERTLSGRTQEL